MKKSEIKDLYNQSNEALTLLKAYVKMLPFADGNKATLQAIDTAAHLVTIVKTMCDYMIDDGCTDMTARLQDIKAEAKQIELDVARMDYDKERFLIMLNCRAIINNIKDMEEWTANSVEPQQAAPEAPQQPSVGNSRELAGNSNETQSEGKRQTVIKKEDLPTIYDDEVNKAREQQVLYNAIKGGWMTLNGTTYKWQKNYDYLALMCGLLYWGDKVKEDIGANTDSLGEYPRILSKSTHRFSYKSGEIKKTSKDINKLFGGVNVSNNRSQLDKLPEEYGSITRLFPKD